MELPVSARIPALLYVVWTAFLIRGFFYAGALPLWEGFDEYAHFAYVEQIVQGRQLLVDRAQTVPADVARSLQIAPLPWELRSSAGYPSTLEAFWKLAPEERYVRIAQLRRVTPQSAAGQSAGGPNIYEALQPPLYYWLAAPVYSALRERTLVEAVLVIRCFSVAIASLLVPLVFIAARRAFEIGAAIGIAAAVALLPELFFDVVRVGNECLGTVLFTVLFLLCSGPDRRELAMRRAAAIGAVLGLGLLTKAYFLTAVPALILCTAPWRSGKQALRVAIAFGVAVLISGWWFVLNQVHTGTWSGLNEAVMVKGISSTDTLRGIARVDWRTAIDSILISHIWFGGWSSLQARSWIYHLYMVLGLSGAVGVIFCIQRLRSGVMPALWFYLWFWAGQLYNVLLLFLSKGASTSMGWYLYAVIAAEAILLVHGFRFWSGPRFARFIAPGCAILAGLLDLYTMHVIALPYYAGLTSHRQNGSLANLSLSDLYSVGAAGVVQRLTITKPVWVAILLPEMWICFLIATVALMIIPMWANRIRHHSYGNPEISQEGGWFIQIKGF